MSSQNNNDTKVHPAPADEPETEKKGIDVLKSKIMGAGAELDNAKASIEKTQAELKKETDIDETESGSKSCFYFLKRFWDASMVERAELLNKMNKFRKGAALASKDADTLDAFEAENDDEKTWTQYIQKGIMVTVAFVVLMNILISNLSLIGTEKSNSTDFSIKEVLTYPTDQLYDLVELNLFVNMSSESVLTAMECHAQNNYRNKKVCLRINRKKCMTHLDGDFVDDGSIIVPGPQAYLSKNTKTS